MNDDVPEDPPPRRRLAAGIPLHDLLELDGEVPPEGATQATVSMPVAAPAFGSAANLHGGAIATLVDVACALAAARASGWDPTTQSMVTADMHLRYLGRPHTDTVHAHATVEKVGRLLIVVTCRVTDADGHVVAVADFSAMLVPLRGALPVAGEEAPPPTEPGAPEL